MRTLVIAMMGCFLISACNDSKPTKVEDSQTTESVTNKRSLQETSGNLQAEIEYVYSFFQAMHYSSPAKSAEGWCANNSSWNYEDNGPGGYVVYTEDRDSYVRKVGMHDNYYTADFFSTPHENVCQSLRNIFGEPSRTSTLHEGEYSEWNTDDGIKISVEKDGISSTISFAISK